MFEKSFDIGLVDVVSSYIVIVIFLLLKALPSANDLIYIGVELIGWKHPLL